MMKSLLSQNKRCLRINALISKCELDCLWHRNKQEGVVKQQNSQYTLAGMNGFILRRCGPTTGQSEVQPIHDKLASRSMRLRAKRTSNDQNIFILTTFSISILQMTFMVTHCV